MELLPEHDLTNMPWYKVAINLIGLWTAKTEHFNGEFYVLTSIDTTTNLVELVCIDTKSSDDIARKFENTWLARYPRPAQVIYNNGSEFTGYAIASLLYVLGIKDIPTTSKNPQSNAIFECMHQTMVTVLKSLLLSWCSQTSQDVLHLVDDGLATTMYSMRSTISVVLKASSGALAFSHDMLLNVPLVTEWQTITCNVEELVNDALLKNNQRRINYDFYVWQRVLKHYNTIKGKLAVKTSSPFEIAHIHVNSSITIQLWIGVMEQINILCTIPYRDSLL